MWNLRLSVNRRFYRHKPNRPECHIGAARQRTTGRMSLSLLAELGVRRT